MFSGPVFVDIRLQPEPPRRRVEGDRAAVLGELAQRVLGPSQGRVVAGLGCFAQSCTRSVMLAVSLWEQLAQPPRQPARGRHHHAGLTPRRRHVHNARPLTTLGNPRIRSREWAESSGFWILTTSPARVQFLQASPRKCCPSSLPLDTRSGFLRRRQASGSGGRRIVEKTCEPDWRDHSVGINA